MSAVKRLIPGTFSKVPGGYARTIDERTTLFVPDMCASSFIPETGELYGYSPDYDALEAEKLPAVQAKAPGEYAYYYETQHVPNGCDYSADLSYYGKHYFLRPLHDGLPPLHGRGITYDDARKVYTVTLRAYEKLKEHYCICHEMCFD